MGIIIFSIFIITNNIIIIFLSMHMFSLWLWMITNFFTVWVYFSNRKLNDWANSIICEDFTVNGNASLNNMDFYIFDKSWPILFFHFVYMHRLNFLTHYESLIFCENFSVLFVTFRHSILSFMLQSSCQHVNSTHLLVCIFSHYLLLKFSHFHDLD